MTAKAQVVVSYAKVDHVRVLEWVGRLRSAGVDVWIDEAAIDGAALWGKAIVEAIDACKVLVLMCTEAAFGSDNVRKEIGLASESNRAILPLRLEPVETPAAIKYQLVGIQYLDVYGDDTDAAFAAVLRSLDRLGVEREGSTFGLAPTEATTEAPPDPDKLPTLQRLAETNRELYRYDLGRRAETRSALNSRGDVASRLGREQEALEYYEQALAAGTAS